MGVKGPLEAEMRTRSEAESRSRPLMPMTAASCEARASLRTESSPTANRTDTDLGAFAVMSNPRTDDSP